MIIKKEKKNGIIIYHVDKDISDEKMEELKNTYIKPDSISYIIEHDADVYDVNNNLLLKFRKGKLSNKKIEDFYLNVIDFAKNKTNNRGSTSNSKNKNIYENPKIMSNILGYMDTFSPKQKFLINQQKKKIKLQVRETRYNMDYPEKFKKLVPLISEINNYYKEYIPLQYKKQENKAKYTLFKIPGTAFTTITTNINFQTTIHKDKGDDPDGFGNLAVIERGVYSGGETCFPQYGIGVNVRTCDILFMNVHEWHGNLKIFFKTKDAIRLSIVCYLRINVWKNTLNINKKGMVLHNKTIKNLRKNKVVNKTLKQ
jgi:hypothetical protein